MLESPPSSDSKITPDTAKLAHHVFGLLIFHQKLAWKLFNLFAPWAELWIEMRLEMLGLFHNTKTDFYLTDECEKATPGRKVNWTDFSANVDIETFFHCNHCFLRPIYGSLDLWTQLQRIIQSRFVLVVSMTSCRLLGHYRLNMVIHSPTSDRLIMLEYDKIVQDLENHVQESCKNFETGFVLEWRLQFQVSRIIQFLKLYQNSLLKSNKRKAPSEFSEQKKARLRLATFHESRLTFNKVSQLPPRLASNWIWIVTESEKLWNDQQIYLDLLFSWFSESVISFNAAVVDSCKSLVCLRRSFSFKAWS